MLCHFVFFLLKQSVLHFIQGEVTFFCHYIAESEGNTNGENKVLTPF